METTPITHACLAHVDSSRTLQDCLRLAEDIKIQEPAITSDGITSLGVIMLQLWIHMTVNSKQNGTINIYTGKLKDGLGVYPNEETDHPLIDKASGRFHIDPDLGLMHFNDPDGKLRLMVGDLHRVTENFFLASAHLFAHRLHNQLLDEGVAKGYGQAKQFTLSCLARIFMDAHKRMTGAETDQEVFNNALELRAVTRNTMVTTNFMNTKEAVFAVLRLHHALVPSFITFQGGPTPIFSRNTDIIKGVDWMGLPFGEGTATNDTPAVSQSMTEMHHIGGEPDIRRLTMSRFCERGLCSFESLKQAMDGERPNTRNRPLDETPLWLGLLNEAKGKPGPVATAFLDRCMIDSLEGPAVGNTPLLDNRVDTINESTENVISFLEG